MLRAHDRRVDEAAAKGEEGEAVDYRPAWGSLLAASPDEICPGRLAKFEALPKLVRIHLSIEDGECQVERDLGMVTAAAREHVGASDPVLADTVILRTSGPKGKEELCTEGNTGPRPTALCCVWARTWRAAYGARLWGVRRKEGPRRGEQTPTKRAKPGRSKQLAALLPLPPLRRRPPYNAASVCGALASTIVYGQARSGAPARRSSCGGPSR